MASEKIKSIVSGEIAAGAAASIRRLPVGKAIAEDVARRYEMLKERLTSAN
jgi:hypothetical protein